MAPPITIRPANPSDAGRLGVLAGGLVRMHHATDPKRFMLPDGVESGYAWWLEREMRRDQAIVLVAESAGEVIGYSYATMEDRDYNRLIDGFGELHDVFVTDSERGRGVGRQLLQAMLAALEARGIDRIVLSTMVDNEAAQRMFRAAGFRPTMLEMTRNAERP